MGGHLFRTCPVRRRTFAELFDREEGHVDHPEPPGPAAPSGGPVGSVSGSPAPVPAPVPAGEPVSAPASVPVPAVPPPPSPSASAPLSAPPPHPVPAPGPSSAPAPVRVPAKDSPSAHVPCSPPAPPPPILAGRKEKSGKVMEVRDGLAALAAAVGAFSSPARAVEVKAGEGDITSPPEGPAPRTTQDQAPAAWADSSASSAVGEGMAEWAVASARKRAPPEDMDYPRGSKETPSIPLANRFQVLADEAVAVLDLGMEVESPTLIEGWDGSEMEETMGMVSQELGDQGGQGPK